MPVGFDLVSILDLVGVFVDVYPIQLWRVVCDGGDKAFALPAPLEVRVFEKVAGEWVADEFLDVGVFGRVDVDV